MAEYLWKEKLGQYSTGEYLTLNGFKIGSYYWNSSRPKGENSKLVWGIHSDLPCLAPKIKDFETKEQAKEALETFTKRWFERMR